MAVENSLSMAAMNGGGDMLDATRTVRMRGLPYNCRVQQIKEFFGGDSTDLRCITVQRITTDALTVDAVRFLTTPDGRLAGEALVQFTDASMLPGAMAKNREMIENRYMEIFETSEQEIRSRMPTALEASRVVRLRGIPFECHKQMVFDFFEGLNVTDVHLCERGDGRGPRLTGEAYVRFATSDDASRAHEFHQKLMGRRYIEVFQSTDAEYEKAMNPPHIGNGPPSLLDMGGPRFGGPGGQWRGGGPRGGGAGQWRGPPPGWRGNGPQGWGPPPPRNQWDGGYSVRGGPPGGAFGGGGPRKRFADDGPQAAPTVVRMRGLPWKATREDIEKFFKPLTPWDIDILMNNEGRPSGQARVTFDSPAAAKEAMKKNREYMGERYIELSLDSMGGSEFKRSRYDDGPPGPYGAGGGGGPGGYSGGYDSSYPSYGGGSSGGYPGYGAQSTVAMSGYPPQQQQQPYQQPQAQGYGQQMPAQMGPQMGAQMGGAQSPEQAEWDRYWREYEEYKRKYEEYAEQMRRKGMQVAPMQPPAAPAGAPPPRASAPPPPPAAPPQQQQGFGQPSYGAQQGYGGMSQGYGAQQYGAQQYGRAW